MAKIVKLEHFYVEVAERPTLVAAIEASRSDDGIERVGGTIEKVADKLVDAKETIVAVCEYVREAFEAANRPDELKLKFGIKLGGEVGVPYVTKGTGEATMEIEATWKREAGSGIPANAG